MTRASRDSARAGILSEAALGRIGSHLRRSTFHVKTNGSDALSGANWPMAKQTVAAALSVASTNDEVWIAAGRYPERIIMKPGVALYGGFAGVETARDQRNWTTNRCILDGSSEGRVVNITNAGPGTRIDGMVITGGLGIHGGGIAMVGSGPVIANNTVTGNITDGAGAGISIGGLPPREQHGSLSDPIPSVTNATTAWRLGFRNSHESIRSGCAGQSSPVRLGASTGELGASIGYQHYYLPSPARPRGSGHLFSCMISSGPTGRSSINRGVACKRKGMNHGLHGWEQKGASFCYCPIPFTTPFPWRLLPVCGHRRGITCSDNP